jgi:hypothetical protein
MKLVLLWSTWVYWQLLLYTWYLQKLSIRHELWCWHAIIYIETLQRRILTIQAAYIRRVICPNVLITSVCNGHCCLACILTDFCLVQVLINWVLHTGRLMLYVVNINILFEIVCTSYQEFFQKIIFIFHHPFNEDCLKHSNISLHIFAKTSCGMIRIVNYDSFLQFRHIVVYNI